MSEPKLISPLLDGFAMGNPISEHSGIRCCPAIKENTDKKYIVKIIAIPASQVQMDALLLAGAYKDPSGAMDYFREKGEEILQEAELLKKLSKLDGFLSYDGWQMEPITRHRLGYEIYLVGSYKRSLEKYIRHHAVTHLEAVNLGLDLCSALSVCREAGALYVDLKPSNIFMSDRKEYRIGDLGFVSLDALSYTALPEKYHSSYTAPELYDPMESINLTADTYSLGMVLYQLYNDGNLPFKGQAPAEPLPTPANADYELAEIIMKAIHPDPQQRWTDPKEMGKALASYMQRNTINDTPITPLKIRKPKTKKVKKNVPDAVEAVDAVYESVADTTEAEIPVSTLTEDSPPTEQDSPEASISDTPETTDGPSEQPSDTIQPEAEVPEDDVQAKDLGEEDIPDDLPQAAVEELPDASSEEDVLPPETMEAPEDTTEDAEDAYPYELSDELSRIMAKADDLIAHETPEGVVIPEIPDLPDPFAFVLDEEEEIDDSDVPYDPLMEDEQEIPDKKKKKIEKKFADPKYKRRAKRFVSLLILLAVLVLLAMGGFWYYQNIYLQTINSITIVGSQEELTVLVDTQADESLLQVTCRDNYGNTLTQGVTDGKASFSGLESNTMYTIELEIDGFHGLVGKTSDIYTTEATTKIVSFTSVAGAEDGSVMLNFTVDGDEPEEWAIIYSAEGEDARRQTFTGHSITINGLSLGKVYTFRLDAGEALSLSGEYTLDLMATRLILAENLTVSSSSGNDMTVHWDAPGDVVVDSWDVRCYSENGYDEQLTVTDTEVLFTGIDPSAEYTIEVTASGMTQPARTGITANPINVSALHVDDSDSDKLTLTWDHTGNEPEGGWLLLYSIDGSENYVVKSNKASASVSPKIPGGKYIFTIQAADGTSIFSNVHPYTAADAVSYEGNALTADMLSVDLVKTPQEETWYYENIPDDQLTSEFTVGDSISIVLRSSDSFYLPGTETHILYVIRDSYGNVLSQFVSEEKIVWKQIWNGGDVKNGELDIPNIPSSAGSYVLDLYFDGMSVAQLPFTLQ